MAFGALAGRQLSVSPPCTKARASRSSASRQGSGAKAQLVTVESAWSKRPPNAPTTMAAGKPASRASFSASCVSVSSFSTGNCSIGMCCSLASCQAAGAALSPSPISRCGRMPAARQASSPWSTAQTSRPFAASRSHAASGARPPTTSRQASWKQVSGPCRRSCGSCRQLALA